MSRSNPSDNSPNPSTRWHEWAGGSPDGGYVTYYDKAVVHKDEQGKEVKGTNMMVKLPFTFILLDELARVSGWHEASKSGITSNEVRDTTQDVMLVKSFKGGVLANGLYTAIKDRVHAVGGYYETNCYIAYRDTPTTLKIGAIGFAGAALNAWVEFKKANRAELYKQAVQIVGFAEGKKGKIVFRTPKFSLRPISPEAEAAAVEMDKELQAYLKAYFARQGHTKADTTAAPQDHDVQQDAPPDSHADQHAEEQPPEPPPEDSEVPF